MSSTSSCELCIPLQGRFSGRLETKDDEKRLVEECRLAGPLLGGIGKRGERSRMSLAKIVRGLATGEIRSFLEAREAHIKVTPSTAQNNIAPSLRCTRTASWVFMRLASQCMAGREICPTVMRSDVPEKQIHVPGEEVLDIEAEGGH